MRLKEKCEEMKSGDRRVLAWRLADGEEEYRLFLFLMDRKIRRFEMEKEGRAVSGDIYRANILEYSANIDAFYLDIGNGEKVFLPAGGKKEKGYRTVRIVTAAHGSKLAKASEKLGLGAEEEKELNEKVSHMPGCGLLKRGRDGVSAGLEFLADGGGKFLSEDKALAGEAVKLCSERGLGAQGVEAQLYEDADVPLTLLFDIRKRLTEICAKRVHLKSGGEIVIEKTEAMTVIDVNSAKAGKGRNREDTFLALNLEAAECVAWQTEARNLSGMILVDMINMKNEESVTILLDKIEQLLKGIKPSAKLEDITKLGILEISRKRMGADIYEYMDILNRTILL